MYADKERSVGGIHRSVTMLEEATKASPERAGPVVEALVRLGEEVNRAEANFERLADKLKPVRMPVPQKESGAEGHAGTCDLADRIFELAVRVRMLGTSISEVREEVCL